MAGAVLEGGPRRGRACPMAALADGLAGSDGWPNLGHRGTAALGRRPGSSCPGPGIQVEGAARRSGVCEGRRARGWATWCWAIPALFAWGWPTLGAAVLLGVAAASVLLMRLTPPVVMGLSLIRYAVFALQYLLFLTAFGAIAWGEWWTEACPRIAAVWCAVGTCLGLRSLV